MYRPPNWNEIKRTALDLMERAIPFDGKSDSYSRGYETGIEFGVDAIIEALKEGGIKAKHIAQAFLVSDGSNAVYQLSDKTLDNTMGWLIFIPEEAE